MYMQVAATEGDPVPYDIFYLVLYLLVIKAEIIYPLICRSLIKQNGNYQSGAFLLLEMSRSADQNKPLSNQSLNLEACDATPIL